MGELKQVCSGATDLGYSLTGSASGLDIARLQGEAEDQDQRRHLCCAPGDGKLHHATDHTQTIIRNAALRNVDIFQSQGGLANVKRPAFGPQDEEPAELSPLIHGLGKAVGVLGSLAGQRSGAYLHPGASVGLSSS
ncbi:MAG: hypothetical protein ACJA00_005652 [Myxococcota bacterium]